MKSLIEWLLQIEFVVSMPSERCKAGPFTEVSGLQQCCKSDLFVKKWTFQILDSQKVLWLIGQHIKSIGQCNSDSNLFKIKINKIIMKILKLMIYDELLNAPYMPTDCWVESMSFLRIFHYWS